MKTTAPPAGRLIQKHQRQVVLLVKAPPINGPAKLAMENVAPNTPMYMARFWGATDRAMMVYTQHDPGAPHARECTADDEGDGILRDGTDQRADLEDGNGQQEDQLQRPESVRLAPDVLEVGGDLGNRGRDDVESRATRNMLSISAWNSPMTCTPVR